VAEVKTYTAVYERDGDAWLVAIAGEPRCHSWGRTLTAAHSHIRDALALWLDQSPDSLEILDEVRLPRELERQLSTVRQSKEALEHFQQTVTQATAQAAKALTESGLSMRDAARIMGKSHQRIDQLLDIAKPDVTGLMNDLRRCIATIGQSQEQPGQRSA
jgi:predicted RNase H-like HicB family nuclease